MSEIIDAPVVDTAGNISSRFPKKFRIVLGVFLILVIAVGSFLFGRSYGKQELKEDVAQAQESSGGESLADGRFEYTLLGQQVVYSADAAENKQNLNAYIAKFDRSKLQTANAEELIQLKVVAETSSNPEFLLELQQAVTARAGTFAVQDANTLKQNGFLL